MWPQITLTVVNRSPIVIVLEGLQLGPYLTGDYKMHPKIRSY